MKNEKILECEAGVYVLSGSCLTLSQRYNSDDSISHGYEAVSDPRISNRAVSSWATLWRFLY